MKMGNLELDPLSSPLDGFFAPLQLKRIHRHHVPAVRRLFEACLSLTRASTSEHRRGRAYQRLSSPLHLVPTTCGPSACRTQALSCPDPVCSTASPGPLPSPDLPLGAAYSAGLSLSPVCASWRSRSISSIPATRFTSFSLSGIQTPILCKGFHDIHLFIPPSRMYQNREGKYVIERGLISAVLASPKGAAFH